MKNDKSGKLFDTDTGDSTVDEFWKMMKGRSFESIVDPFEYVETLIARENKRNIPKISSLIDTHSAEEDSSSSL